MRAAHFDCFSGISGDMTLGALIDAGVDANAVRAALDSPGLPIKLVVEKIRKGGFAATQASVEAPDEHVHRHPRATLEVKRILHEHWKECQESGGLRKVVPAGATIPPATPALTPAN